MASETYGSDRADDAYTNKPLKTPAPSGVYDEHNVGTAASESRSLGELFGELSSDMSDLLRQEVALAQAEIMGKVGKVAGGAGMAAGGGMVAYAGLILLLVAIAFFLAQWMTVWIATGIVAIVALVIGLVLLQLGRSRIQSTSLTPEKTIESLKQDVEWAKEQVQ